MKPGRAFPMIGALAARYVAALLACNGQLVIQGGAGQIRTGIADAFEQFEADYGSLYRLLGARTRCGQPEYRDSARFLPRISVQRWA